MKFWGKIKIKCRSGNGKLLIDLHGPNSKIAMHNYRITAACRTPSYTQSTVFC